MTPAKKAPAKAPVKAAARTATPRLTPDQRIAALEKAFKAQGAQLRGTTWLLAELLQGLRVAAIKQALNNPETQQALARRMIEQPGDVGGQLTAMLGGG